MIKLTDLDVASCGVSAACIRGIITWRGKKRSRRRSLRLYESRADARAAIGDPKEMQSVRDYWAAYFAALEVEEIEMCRDVV